MKMQDLKNGLKPFFIFVVLFEAIYVIVTILFGYPMLIIADKLRMNKYFRNRVKTDQRQEEQTADLRE